MILVGGAGSRRSNRMLVSPPRAAQERIHPNPEFANLIHPDARFASFAQFEDHFGKWKGYHLHPFRVASSETLRDADGTVNEHYRYRYVVYHCTHYGEPRMRGAGKRPNQSYMPCGCRAMLRLNYSFAEKCLKVTTIHDEHSHEVSEEMYVRVSQKIRRSSAGRRGNAGSRRQSVSPYPMAAVAPPPSRRAVTPQQQQAAAAPAVDPVHQMLVQYQMQQQQLLAAFYAQQYQQSIQQLQMQENIPPVVQAAAVEEVVPASSPEAPEEVKADASPVAQNVEQRLFAPVPIRPQPLGSSNMFGQSIARPQVQQPLPIVDMVRSIQNLLQSVQLDAGRAAEMSRLLSRI